MKKGKEQQIIENCLSSDLSNMISEFESGELSTSTILQYFSDFLLDANIDSRIIVNVLERKSFGENGKEAARTIKVTEGW